MWSLYHDYVNKTESLYFRDAKVFMKQTNIGDGIGMERRE